MLLATGKTCVFAQYPFKKTSVLSSGDFYKLAVTADGIYKIDYDFLKDNGIKPSDVDLNTFGVFGTRTGMLPQSNNQLLVDDLEEIALRFYNGNDGSFDKEDYFLFYGQGPNPIYYDARQKTLKQELHLYDTINYYFLTLSRGSGKSMSTRESKQKSIGTVSIYDDFIFHESDEYNLLKSGREWYGDKINASEEVSFLFPMTGTVPHRSIQIHADFLSTATSKSVMKVSANTLELGQTEIKAVPQTLYGIKGVRADDEFRVRVDDLNGNETLKLSFGFSNENDGTGYLDRFTLQTPKFIQLYGNQTAFQSLTSLNYGTTAFIVNAVDDEQVIWDITNPLAPVHQQHIIQSNGKGLFRTTTDSLRRFVIFKGNEFPSPIVISRTSPQNLHGLSSADGVIITVNEFMTEAERLAQFRREFNGLSVHVVDQEQIFNEFSGGRRDVTALRNFIRMLYEKNEQLKYVLLFGDASFSYKDGSMVLSYQSTNSLHNVHSYASDDYYGFMDPDEGEWLESSSINNVSHDLEIGVGRVPVTDLKEAGNIVDKLIRYENSPESLGDWRNRVAFIADDGESNKFQLQSDFLANGLESVQPSFNPNRIFVDAFPQDLGYSPVTEEINNSIQNGVLIMDFIGHGGETAWTNEGILRSSHITEWINTEKLPIFLTATCEFGRFDDPDRQSGAELAVLQPNGGAIGMFTTTRPVFLGTNFELSKAFYKNLDASIKKGGATRLGDLMRTTKNDSEAGVVNRNFSLLGDPFTTLSFPKETIVLTDIKRALASGNDTLFHPLDKVVISGEVRSEGELDASFDGTMELSILDKPTLLKTLGEGGPETAMEYHNRKNILFRGQATVRSGRFEARFVLPLDLDTLAGEAKISMYGSHDRELTDATGYDMNMRIGEIARDPSNDNTAPNIRAYLNDEVFESGDLVASNPRLHVQLSDENGINLSTKNNRGITAVLDDQQTIDLTPFYKAEIDRFDKGSVVYDLIALPVGKHHLSIEAYDSYNNKAYTEIEFFVVDSTQIILSKFNYFPNPSNECVNFNFKHKNLPKGALITLSLFSRDGKRIKRFTEPLIYDESQDEYQGNLEVCKSTNGSLIQEGLYYFIFEITPGNSPKNRRSGRLVFSQ
ncbi:type IX secretion system sortase PorU [Fulvivirga sp. M361]|uniref:type IX secretion system sortase PorU n=1 Tax=Fulvivirga sp. M361 TaxID=2594266 RepID=UPI0016241636|nr:type IX secretion system sortase PorU [Fulvivirga sp. M361]